MSEDSSSRRTSPVAAQGTVTDSATFAASSLGLTALPGPLTIAKTMAPFAAFAAVLLFPTPDGLSPEGHRTLAVMVLALGLWLSDLMPNAVAGLLAVVALLLVSAVPDATSAMYGFTQHAPYFIVAILALGSAVARSGLAERLAVWLLRLAQGRPRRIYTQMLLAFVLSSFIMPVATGRTALMMHVYERLTDAYGLGPGSPLHRVLLLTIATLNRNASAMLLAGGIGPVVAAPLLGDFNWTRWFLLMSVPFYISLVASGTAFYFCYRSSFKVDDLPRDALSNLKPEPVKWMEYRAGLILLGAVLLWFTDFAHGLPPVVPALIAMIAVLTPRVGLLSWSEFERSISWSTFFTIGAALSIAHAMVATGAADWLAGVLGGTIGYLGESPMVALLALTVAAAILKGFLGDLAGFMAFAIPVGMAAGSALGLNPLVAGLAVMFIGQTVAYLPAQTAQVFVYERAGIPSHEVFRLGLVITLVSITVILLVAVPYWSLLGEGLAR